MKTQFSFFKRILPLMMACLLTTGNLAAANPSGKVLYLSPNSNWNQSSAWFALYAFGTGNAWANFSQIGSTGIYAATVPTGTWTNVIMVRMNPSYNSGSWAGKWNQSADLTYDGSSNLFTVADWSGGEWSNYAPPLQSATLAATNYSSGSGTSADPYIVYKGYSATLTTTATQYVTDADMVVQTALVTGGTTGNFATGTSITYTPSATGNYTIQTKARNYKNYGTSTTGAEYTTNTLYFSVLNPPTEYTISVTNGKSSASKVTADGSATLVADSIDCKFFSSWSVTGTATQSSLTNDTLTLSNIQSDISATANYTSYTMPTALTLSLSETDLLPGDSTFATLTVTGTSNITYAYQYQKSGTSGWTTYRTTSGTSLWLALAANDYNIRVVTNPDLCSQTVNSNTVALTVNAPDTIGWYMMGQITGTGTTEWSNRLPANQFKRTINNSKLYVWESGQTYSSLKGKYFKFGDNKNLYSTSDGTSNDVAAPNAGSANEAQLYINNSKCLIMPNTTQTDLADNDQVDFYIRYDGSSSHYFYYASHQQQYRLRSKAADGRIFYSNSGIAGDTLSTYCDAGNGSLWLQRIDGGKWKNIDQQTPSGVDSMLITGVVSETASDTTVSINAYNGNIYIRTDGASGGWNNYLQNDSNLMTQWAPNRSLASEYYNYYWLKWMNANTNIKAGVANEYNKNLTNTVEDLTLTAGANTRYAYDSKTNTFYRNLIGDAGTTKFLEITEYKVNNDSALIRDTSNVAIGYKGADGKILSDVSNWTYYIDTYCYPGAAVHLEGTQQDIGTKVLVDSLVVLSNTTSPQKKFRIRLIYHYAQNRIVHAWLPDSASISSDYQIGSGVLFVRQDDSLTNMLNMQKNTPATVIADRIYFSLEINKSEWQKKKNAQQQVYFFSLPYTCRIEDIYGSFDKTNYGTKWLIQRYRGDKRAQYGLTTGSNYWADMKQTATLEAGRGYVLLTNFTASDFKEANGIERLRFYFPSASSSFTFSYQGTLMDSLEAYPCTINIPDSLLIVGSGYGDRRQLDNNWHVCGIPGVKSMTVDNVNIYDSVPTAPNYVYKYTMRTSTDNSEASQYKLFSTVGSSFVMEPFFSYFMQYAGRIQWKDYTSTSPTLAPRRISETKQTTESYPVVLSHENGTDDQMFITLSANGTTDFESDRDILKMLLTGKNFPQLYANMQNERWGALDLPNETQTVSLGFYSCADGMHNIALAPNNTQDAKSVLLYDKEQNTYHNLQTGSYSFTAIQGTCNERFEITISKTTDITTQTPHTANSSYRVFASGNTLFVENLPEQTIVRLYDITGRYIAGSMSSCGQIHFGSLPSGVYMLFVQDTENKCTKVIVR